MRLKINRLETHDRLQHLHKQRDEIGICCQNIINQRPFGDKPFYIFAHKREVGMDEKFSLMLTGKYNSMGDVPTHRMIWQPRLTKPKAQTNSMLFKAYPGTDTVKIIWILPERELWEQYTKGKITQSEIVVESIHRFQNDRESLEAREDDDATDSEIDAIYHDLSLDANFKKV